MKSLLRPFSANVWMLRFFDVLEFAYSALSRLAVHDTTQLGVFRSETSRQVARRRTIFHEFGSVECSKFLKHLSVEVFEIVCLRRRAEEVL